MATVNTDVSRDIVLDTLSVTHQLQIPVVRNPPTVRQVPEGSIFLVLNPSPALGYSDGTTIHELSSGIGVQGLQGNIGAQGVQGTNIGNQGVQGLNGNQGFFGSQGNQGANITLGSQGFQGSQGVIGIQGSQGNQGFSQIGFQGSQGAQGNPGGTQGAQGAQGTGTQGAQGTPGGPGQIGIQGIQGSQGIQGGQGNFNFYQGAQGAQGTLGPQGNQGFTNPNPGPNGNQGATGTQGSQGANGITDSLSINTYVYTIQGTGFSTSATATLSRWGSAREFSLSGLSFTPSSLTTVSSIGTPLPGGDFPSNPINIEAFMSYDGSTIYPVSIFLNTNGTLMFENTAATTNTNGGQFDTHNYSIQNASGNYRV
jgi:hypothetical protein